MKVHVSSRLGVSHLADKLHTHTHTHIYIYLSVCLSLLLSFAYIGQGNGAVRLFKNGYSSISFFSGIVQVYYNGQWGNICFSPGFALSEATVVCHQLGFVTASGYSSSGVQK